MDFHYSPEDEAFRLELRTWLEANIPEESSHTDDPFMEDSAERSRSGAGAERKEDQGVPVHMSRGRKEGGTANEQRMGSSLGQGIPDER